MLRAALIAGCVVLFAGCRSMYVYPDPDMPKGAVATSALSGLVLGVERKEGVQAPYDLQTFIDALNEYQVFRQAAFVDQLDTQPDLVLRNYGTERPGFRGYHGEKGGLLCVAMMNLVSSATLTILPIYCNVEDDVTFTLEAPASPASRAFSFTRNSKDLLGIWAPVVAKLDPSWQRVSYRGDSQQRADAELARRYKKYVVQKLRELEPDIVRLTRNAEPPQASREQPAASAR